MKFPYELDGEIVICESCYCKEEKPGRTYLIQLDKPEDGVEYMVAHESCLQEVKEPDDG